MKKLMIIIFFLVMLISCKQTIKPASDQMDSNVAPKEEIEATKKDQIEETDVIGKTGDPFLDSLSSMNHLYYQDDDCLLLYDKNIKQGEGNGAHIGVMRLTGYTDKDVGAAYKGEDSLLFVVTEYSDIMSGFIEDIDYPNKKVDDKLVINLSVPNIYDPGHVIKKSTKDDQVVVIVQFLPDMNRGGWVNIHRVMMFQKKSDLDIEFVDDYSDEEYKHFYDGV